MHIQDFNGDGLLQLNEFFMRGDIVVLATPEIAGLPYVIYGLRAAGRMASGMSTAVCLVLANSNSTYQWKVLSAPTSFGTMDSLVSPQNDSVSILWNGAIGTYDLQVVEIDSNGCEGLPSIVSVNLVSQPSAISPISNITKPFLYNCSDSL